MVEDEVEQTYKDVIDLLYLLHKLGVDVYGNTDNIVGFHLSLEKL
jgi:hypothetical protein